MGPASTIASTLPLPSILLGTPQFFSNHNLSTTEAMTRPSLVGGEPCGEIDGASLAGLIPGSLHRGRLSLPVPSAISESVQHLCELLEPVPVATKYINPPPPSFSISISFSPLPPPSRNFPPFPLLFRQQHCIDRQVVAT